MYSCDKKELGPTLEIVNAPVLFDLETTAYTLTKDNADDTIITFKWAKAEYNVPTEIYYTVEIAKAGTNFSKSAVIVTETHADSASITAFNLNLALTVELGLPVEEESKLEIRVNSYVGQSEPTPSNTIEISAITFNPPYTPASISIKSGDKELKVLKILDEYVGNTTLNIGETGLYEGYVWIKEGELSINFKGNDSENKTLGAESSTETGVITTYVLSKNATDPIVVDSVGYYRFKIDMNTSTVEIMGTKWGVIGSGIPPYDWSVSEEMIYSIDDDLWTVELEAQAGEFKFRPNQAWDPWNYGDDGNDGTLNPYGANIPIEAGNKKITLDLSEFPYAYSIEDLSK